jgi:hypothetical protein
MKGFRRKGFRVQDLASDRVRTSQQGNTSGTLILVTAKDWAGESLGFLGKN